MDGLIPWIFKALRKKKAMKHYRSLSSGPAHVDVAAAELARQDLFMTPQHPRAARWHREGGDPAAPAAMAMAPLRERARSGNAQRLAAMEALARETFSPRKHEAVVDMERATGRSYLGGK